MVTVCHRFFYAHFVGGVAPTYPLHTASTNSLRTFHELINFLVTYGVICVRLILTVILIQLNYEN